MSERIAKRIKASTYRDIARYASVMIGNDLGISDIRIRLQNDRDKFYVREGDTFVFDCLDPITKAVEKWIKRYGECEDKTKPKTIKDRTRERIEELIERELEKDIGTRVYIKADKLIESMNKWLSETNYKDGAIEFTIPAYKD